MVPTKSMILAARRAEYDYFHRGKVFTGGRFAPTPDPVIKAMLEAALALVETTPAPITSRRKMAAPEPVVAPTPPDPPPPVPAPRPKRWIVEARKPKARR